MKPLSPEFGGDLGFDVRLRRELSRTLSRTGQIKKFIYFINSLLGRGKRDGEHLSRDFY